MTFSRNYLKQTTFPFALTTFVLLAVFTFFLRMPPEFTFWYGIAIVVLGIIHLVKAVWAVKNLDFEYTISYGSKYIVITTAEGVRNVYDRSSIKPGINKKYFWLQDGENVPLYGYNDKVVEFLDQLE